MYSFSEGFFGINETVFFLLFLFLIISNQPVIRLCDLRHLDCR